MNMDFLCNGEFWIAIAGCFIISLVIATIVQDIFDTFKELSDEEAYDEIDLGCTVFDEETGVTGIFCGMYDDGIHAVVVTVQDDIVYYFYPVLDNLMVQ